MKGTYILVIWLKKSTSIEIGALGNIIFEKGFYFYIGSAMGSGSTTLINRVKRHLRLPENKKTHWHIDYFLNNEHSIIIKIYLIPSVQKLECIIALELIDNGDDIIVNFGCSDCSCNSHLVFFKEQNDLKDIFT